MTWEIKPDEEMPGTKSPRSINIRAALFTGFVFSVILGCGKTNEPQTDPRPLFSSKDLVGGGFPVGPTGTIFNTHPEWTKPENPSSSATPSNRQEISSTASDGALESRSKDGDEGSVFRIVGYYPSWGNGLSTLRFDLLTHIIYAFAKPRKNGLLRPILNPLRLKHMVSVAHENDVKVGISIGGQSKEHRSALHSISHNEQFLARFADQVMDFVHEYDLDGVDIDWEYPTEKQKFGFTRLLSKLASRLRAENKFLSAAVNSHGHCQGIETKATTYLDFMNLMVYGKDLRAPTYGAAEREILYWRDRGIDSEKLVLGVPFFGRSPAKKYKDLVAYDQTAPQKDKIGSIRYNGIPTIQAKTKLAQDQAGGIMIWELTGDTSDDTSLLKAIFEQSRSKHPRTSLIEVDIQRKIINP